MYGELVKKYLDPDIRHEWYAKGMSKERLDEIKKCYEQQYGKGESAGK